MHITSFQKHDWSCTLVKHPHGFLCYLLCVQRKTYYLFSEVVIEKKRKERNKQNEGCDWCVKVNFGVAYSTVLVIRNLFEILF